MTMRKLFTALLASAALLTGSAAAANPTGADQGTSFTLLGQEICVDRSAPSCDVTLRSPTPWPTTWLGKALARMAELAERTAEQHAAVPGATRTR
jgi:hypothetical protein